MKLYVLTGNISYEGSYVLGVYQSHFLAESACEAFRKATEENNGMDFDSYSIKERDLDAPAREEF